MSSETTRPSLLARLRDPRDELAWREFEARYRDLVRRFCRRRGLQESDAEDVSQHVFLALSRALPRFRLDPARGRFRDYLGRVVANAIHNLHSSPNQGMALVDTSVLDLLTSSDEQSLAPEWEEEWAQHHMRLAMAKVRAQTTPESMAVFEQLLAGGSVEEVAAATGSTTAAVYKVRQRIQERLRSEIELQVRDEDPPPG